MKKEIPLVLFLFILLSNCSSPEKLLQAGDFRNAYQVGLRKIQQRKTPKPEHWQYLSQAYNELTQQDLRRIEALELEGAPDRCLVLYPIYQQLAHRQQEVSPYAAILKANGLQEAYSAATLEALIERTRVASGEYCHEQGQLLLSKAQAGDKYAARKGYGWLKRAIGYLPEHTYDLRPLRDELYDLATLRVVIEMVDPIRSPSSEEFVQRKIMQARRTFWRDGWLEVHYQAPAERRIDYYATGEVTEAFSGPDEEYTSHQTYCKEIIVGYETIKEEVTKGDTVIIVEKEIPIKQTVSATVITVQQYKEACSHLNVLLFAGAADTIVQEWSFNDCDDWSNTYEICQGDERALDSSCTGMCFLYPSEASLLSGTANDLRWALERQIKKKFNNFLERPRRRWQTS